MKAIVNPGDRIALKDAGALRVVSVEGLTVTLEISGVGGAPLSVELFPSQQRGQKKNGKPRPQQNPDAAGANGNGRGGNRHTGRVGSGSR